MSVLKEEARARFWSKVKVDEPDGCWAWLANRMPRGYGTFRFNSRQWLAHRVSWVINVGEIPAGMYVLHHCDNPPCVNPSHLFLGTAQDNVDDMLAKGREPSGDKNGARKFPERIKNSPRYKANRPRGERVNTAKLDAATVDAIRADYASGDIGQRALAKKYAISKGMIYYIVNRLSWRHV